MRGKGRRSAAYARRIARLGGIATAKKLSQSVGRKLLPRHRRRPPKKRTA